MYEFITMVNTNIGIISLVVTLILAIIPAIWAYIKHLNLKSKELKFERYKMFHELIKGLIEPSASGQSVPLDRQIIIVYELREYKEYYELLHRMLVGLRIQWNAPEFKRLIDELDRTIKYIEDEIDVKETETLEYRIANTSS